MRHAVDAVGAARDDREAAIDESGRGLHRDMLAVPGGGACADERDGRRRVRQGARIRPRTQSPIGAWTPSSSTAVGQPASPGTTNRAPTRAACASDPHERRPGRGVAAIARGRSPPHARRGRRPPRRRDSTSCVGRSTLDERLGGAHRADRRDRATEHAVAGLGDEAEHGTREGVEDSRRHRRGRR